MSLHISLYLYQNFLLISSPFHHHHRRPSCSSPPHSFDFVAFFTTVTLITNTTDLRRNSDETEWRSIGVTERHLRLSVVRQRCKAGSLLLVRGRWLKLCEGGDDG
ncbi:unnamed protein product [Brassica rapa]|uniref:Uncharacterized protein n=1 Tax=Brassica campestris TaxID=3711 RepID=A0A3P6C9W2_BRACM|nr:unnamed protein product [Brassica rapa]VDD05212.1 unnamed protein product [Brassica rapa]